MDAIEVLNELPSTNAELLARGRAGALHGAAIRARLQTAGRGQRAHAWASPDGGLYLSVLIRLDVPAEALPGLPVACALGILRALHGVGCTSARLKWPNDVVCGFSKLAGILTELGTSDAGVFAVCGVGVNMVRPMLSVDIGAVRSLSPAGLSEELAKLGHPLPDIDELAEQIRVEILHSIARWSVLVAHRAEGEAAAPLAELLEAYNEVLAFVSQPVTVYAIDGEAEASGVFRGVDGHGRALVECEPGVVAAYSSADVSIRPHRPMGA